MFTPPVVFTRKAAISLTTTLTATQIANGTDSQGQTITLPTWMLMRYYIYLGVPEAESDLTSITSGGIDIFMGYERVTGLIDGYKWWRIRQRSKPRGSGAVLVMRP